MHVPFVNLQGQYQDVRESIDRALQGVLERTDYVLGEAVASFERNFADYCGTTHGIGVASGYAALELILRAYDIGPGAEVITAANTFVATAFAIAQCQAKPVLVDIEPGSYNMDPALIEQAITPATRAILVVHLYGQPASMAPIRAIAERHGLLVIEDACQAHGARYHGTRTGALSHAAAFSFYPTKNLGAFGDGGAVVTNDDTLAERIRLLRNLGQRVKNTHEVLGFNHRLDTLHAAILNAQLPRLDSWNGLRRRAAARYAELLAGLELALPAVAPNVEHVYHLYVVRVRSRKRVQAYLESQGVATAIHYPTPLYLQPAFEGLGYCRGDFPHTEAAADEILSLPMFPGLEDEQIAYVAEAIRGAQASLYR